MHAKAAPLQALGTNKSCLVPTRFENEDDYDKPWDASSPSS